MLPFTQKPIVGPHHSLKTSFQQSTAPVLPGNLLLVRYIPSNTIRSLESRLGYPSCCGPTFLRFANHFYSYICCTACVNITDHHLLFRTLLYSIPHSIMNFGHNILNFSTFFAISSASGKLPAPCRILSCFTEAKSSDRGVLKYCPEFPSSELSCFTRSSCHWSNADCSTRTISSISQGVE